MRIFALIRFLALVILTVFAIAACQEIDHSIINSAPSPQTKCQTIQHEMGETEVCGQPQKIVALGPYILEPLLALNVQPAGFADHFAIHQGDYDNPSKQIPYLGSRITHPLANLGSAYNPSIEAILKLQPDLILGTDSNVGQYESLAEIAPTLLLKWTDSERNLRTIAQAVDRSTQAEQLLIKKEQQITAARPAFAAFTATHPKLLLLSSSQLQQIYLGNSAHGLCSSLIEELGFELVSLPEFDDAEPDALITVSPEKLMQLNEADLVVLLGHNFSQLNGENSFEERQLSSLKQAWEKSAIAQSLIASKTGRVYFIPAYLCLGLPGSIGTELYLNELRQRLLSAS